MQSDAVTMSPKHLSMHKSVSVEEVERLLNVSDDELYFPSFSSDSDPGLKWIIALERQSSSRTEGPSILYLKIGVQGISINLSSLTNVVVNSTDASIKFARTTEIVRSLRYHNPNSCSITKPALVVFRHHYSTLPKTLKLEIKIDYIHGLSVVSIPKRVALNADPELKSHFLSLFESKSDADVYFSVDGEIISAHKNILSARSEHFRAMFQSKMKESVGAPIVITDAGAGSIKGMLRFIYGGVLADKSTPDVPGLFAVADKYGLDLLKASCVDILMESLSRENVCERLLMADARACPSLKDECIRFIKGNLEEVMKREEWKEIWKNAELIGAFF